MAKARMVVRLNKYVQERLEEAAALSGMSPQKFLELAVTEKGTDVIEKFNAQKQQQAFAARFNAWFSDIINNPPDPTEALKNAHANYQERRVADTDTFILKEKETKQ